MKKRKALLFTVLFAAMLAISIVTSYSNPLQASSVGKDTLTLITSPDYPPYEYYDTKGGERKIVGFDVDIANTIAKQLATHNYQLSTINYQPTTNNQQSYSLRLNLVSKAEAPKVKPMTKT